MQSLLGALRAPWGRANASEAAPKPSEARADAKAPFTPGARPKGGAVKVYTDRPLLPATPRTREALRNAVIMVYKGGDVQRLARDSGWSARHIRDRVARLEPGLEDMALRRAANKVRGPASRNMSRVTFLLL